MATSVRAERKQFTPQALAQQRPRFANQPSRPYLVEVVGLAGVGKTTLTTALQQQSQPFASNITLARTTLVRYALLHTNTFLPLYLRAWPRCRWFTQAELRALIYLSAWPIALAHQVNPALTQLMDLGPIYRLAYLQEFGSPLTKSARFIQWHTAQIEQWRQLLDMVIMLDAPDAVLQQRINQRRKEHVVKAASVAQSAEFFHRYRAAYQNILARVTTAAVGERRPRILQIDTSQSSVDTMVAQVIHALNQV